MDDIQRIVLDIVFKAERRDVPCSQALAAFIAKVIILENPARFRLDRKLLKADVDDIISMSVQRLCEQDSPALATMRMQVDFDGAYVEQHDALSKHKEEFAKQTLFLERDVCSMAAESGKDIAAFNNMQNLLVDIILHRSGTPTDHYHARRETLAALESVLPKTNLYTFSRLPYLEKKERVTDLFHYVLGIRIFNLFLGKGGADLAVAPHLARSTLNEVATSVLQLLSDVEEETVKYTAVLKAADAKIIDLGGRAPRLRDELVNRRQLLTFVRSFEQEIIRLHTRCELVVSQFDGQVELLRSMVGSQHSVEKERVYPIFEQIAVAWIEGKDVLVHATALQRVLDAVILHAQPSYTRTLQQDAVAEADAWQADNMQAENEARSADETIAHDAALASVTEAAPQVLSVLAPANDGVDQGGAAEVATEQPVSDLPVRVFKERFPFVLSQRIEFSSFCPVTFVDRDALLLPGNPQLGFVLFQKRLYSFASEAALQGFLADPTKYIQGVLDSARTSATLINFLALGEHFPANMLQRAVQGLGHVRATSVAGDTHSLDIQTELHPVASNIDRAHCWNEWELRRRALQMTNVRYKSTHSSQTDHSHFRRENVSQTFPSKSNATQTTVSTGTNPPKNILYVQGLRGGVAERSRGLRTTIEVPPN